MTEDARRRAPDAIAVRAGGLWLTYRELTDRAERLARALRHAGVRPGDLVGQRVERSAALAVSALGTFRAGAAYVAVDPAYPDARVRWMLDDARVAAVVTDAANAGRTDVLDGRALVVLDADGELAADAPADDGDSLPESLRACDLAYVVYTSGSTGRPKGVMVEHAGLANLIAWHRAAFALTDADRCTQIASPGFDASVWELWPTLSCGAALHVVPEELRRDPLGLRDWLVAESITVSFLPTAVAESMIGLPWPPDAPLRFLLTGGDALARRPSAKTPFTVVNNYGCSETTVVATSGTVTPGGSGPPSIGRAVAGVITDVVDDALVPVSPGQEGELIVGGVAAARGYLHRDDLTAERFSRMRAGVGIGPATGVRLRADGELDFLGRADDQLSLRGFRVEPAEVVAALDAHPAIAASAVLATGSSSADRELIAYLVACGDALPSFEELSVFLSVRLPEHMVPASYVWLPELPLTTHGKVDRAALQEATVARSVFAPAAVELSVRLPQTSTERAIASVVCELLEVEQIGMDENFFLLGGHSMLGAQLIVRLEDRFGVEISLRHLFDHPTLTEIVAEAQRQMAAEPVAGTITG